MDYSCLSTEAEGTVLVQMNT